MLMLMLVIVIESYVRVQKTAATGPIDLSRLLWRQPCRLQEIEDDAGNTPAATEERSEFIGSGRMDRRLRGFYCGLRSLHHRYGSDQHDSSNDLVPM